MNAQDKPIFIALPDWELLGLCIEREASGEPDEGKIAVGTVVLNRVDRQGWMGKTLQEVILKPWQFSWTMPEAGKDYYEEAVYMAGHWDTEDKILATCCAISRGLLQGDIPLDADLVVAKCVQYLNPVTASAAKKKWLAAGMKVIKQIGRHQFFMDKLNN